MTEAAKPNTDKIAAMLWDQCIDWNGASLTDESETRNSIYCGQLRAILTERGQLRTDLRHWREEVGKLHSRKADLEAQERLIETLTAALRALVIEAGGKAIPNDSLTAARSQGLTALAAARKEQP